MMTLKGYRTGVKEGKEEQRGHNLAATSRGNQRPKDGWEDKPAKEGQNSRRKIEGKKGRGGGGGE